VLNSSEAWTSVGRYWIGEFNGIIALTPVLLLGVGRAVRWDDMLRNRREAHAAGSGSCCLESRLPSRSPPARDVRLFYPLFAPVTWVALRHGVPGAMISVSLVQARPGGGAGAHSRVDPAVRRAVPLLSLGVTALFLGALRTQRDSTLRQMRQQDAALQALECASPWRASWPRRSRTSSTSR